MAALVIPAAFVGFLILKYSVNLPQWDEWAGVTFLYKLNEGTLSFSDLFRQQNEYRQFFPNLVFVFLGRLTKFDVRYHMGASLLLACLVSFNVYRLGKLTLDRESDRLWAYLAANVLIFSPVQHENWLQGQQLIYFFPIACLSTCLVIATAPRLRFATKCIACAALSIISTFSSVNGILCWLLVLPVLLTWSSAKPRSKRAFAVGWLVAVGLSAILYMYGYVQPVHPASPAYGFAPTQAAFYFFSLVGRPLTLGRFVVTPVIGLGILVMFIWACRQFWRSLNSSIDSQRRLVWLVIGAYALLTAVLITLGRSSFGVVQSLSSRYTTFTIYLPVALVYLFTLEIRKRTGERGFIWNTVSRRVPIVAIAIILTQVPLYILALRSASEARRIQLQVKTCVLLTNVIDDRCLTDQGYPTPDVFRQLANQAENLGLLRPPLITQRNARALAPWDFAVSHTDNSFVEVSQTADHQYLASGRAVVPGTGLPPDAVLLAYDDGKGEDTIFAVAFPKTRVPLRSGLLGKGVDLSWRGGFDERKLPAGRLRITAWGFDAETLKAYRLIGEHMIENADSLELRR